MNMMAMEMAMMMVMAMMAMMTMMAMAMMMMMMMMIMTMMIHHTFLQRCHFIHTCVSIGSMSSAISTFVASRHTNVHPMSFAISSSCRIPFVGSRHIHGWLRHECGEGDDNSRDATLEMTARARQFSSFIMCIGTIDGPKSFQPKHAIIIKNKDGKL
jgi:hypothetical protein